MKIITIPLFVIFTPIFYICYLISAILKSFINLLLIPFDTQRFANAYIAFFSNAKIVYNGIFKKSSSDQNNEETDEEEVEQKTPERRPIGFCCFKTTSQSFSSLPSLPGPPSLPDPGESGENNEDNDEDYEDDENEEPI